MSARGRMGGVAVAWAGVGGFQDGWVRVRCGALVRFGMEGASFFDVIVRMLCTVETEWYMGIIISD